MKYRDALLTFHVLSTAAHRSRTFSYRQQRDRMFDADRSRRRREAESRNTQQQQQKNHAERMAAAKKREEVRLRERADRGAEARKREEVRLRERSEHRADARRREQARLADKRDKEEFNAKRNQYERMLAKHRELVKKLPKLDMIKGASLLYNSRVQYRELLENSGYLPGKMNADQIESLIARVEEWDDKYSEYFDFPISDSVDSIINAGISNAYNTFKTLLDMIDDVLPVPPLPPPAKPVKLVKPVEPGRPDACMFPEPVLQSVFVPPIVQSDSERIPVPPAPVRATLPALPEYNLIADNFGSLAVNTGVLMLLLIALAKGASLGSIGVPLLILGFTLSRITKRKGAWEKNQKELRAQQEEDNKKDFAARLAAHASECARVKEEHDRKIKEEHNRKVEECERKNKEEYERKVEEYKRKIEEHERKVEENKRKIEEHERKISDQYALELHEHEQAMEKYRNDLEKSRDAFLEIENERTDTLHEIDQLRIGFSENKELVRVLKSIFIELMPRFNLKIDAELDSPVDAEMRKGMEAGICGAIEIISRCGHDKSTRMAFKKFFFKIKDMFGGDEDWPSILEPIEEEKGKKFASVLLQFAYFMWVGKEEGMALMIESIKEEKREDLLPVLDQFIAFIEAIESDDSSAEKKTEESNQKIDLYSALFLVPEKLRQPVWEWRAAQVVEFDEEWVKSHTNALLPAPDDDLGDIPDDVSDEITDDADDASDDAEQDADTDVAIPEIPQETPSAAQEQEPQQEQELQEAPPLPVPAPPLHATHALPWLTCSEYFPWNATLGNREWIAGTMVSVTYFRNSIERR